MQKCVSRAQVNFLLKISFTLGPSASVRPVKGESQSFVATNLGLKYTAKRYLRNVRAKMISEVR